MPNPEIEPTIEDMRARRADIAKQIAHLRHEYDELLAQELQLRIEKVVGSHEITER